jgi:hypothetical protein
MVWVRSPVYFYKRNDPFYFSRSIPSDLQHHFKKRKIGVPLRSKSEAKAAKSAAALSDRLGRYWNSLRMEMIYPRELGLKVLQETKPCTTSEYSLSDALALYHQLKGGGKTKLFYDVSKRSIRYLEECLGHDNLTSIKKSDAGRFKVRGLRAVVIDPIELPYINSPNIDLQIILSNWPFNTPNASI